MAVDVTLNSSAVFVNDKCESAVICLVIILSPLLLNAMAIAAVHKNTIHTALLNPHICVHIFVFYDMI